MIQELKYKGYTANPSDYECPDGDLAFALGVVPEDGSLKPILAPKEICPLANNSYKLLFIHKSSTFTHYIFASGYSLYWIDPDSQEHYSTIGSAGSVIKKVEAVGHTLIVLCSDKILYLLWKDNDYVWLGNKLPEISLSFGLRGKPRLYSRSSSENSKFSIEVTGTTPALGGDRLSENGKQKVTERVMAKVNKFLKEQSVDKGRFAQPFFVRYALRLYDGSLVCHSAPVLMNPCTFENPVVFVTDFIENGSTASGSSYDSLECDIMCVTAALDYSLISNGQEMVFDEYMALWSDIVKSVDVFISKPVYTYDSSGVCTDFEDNYRLKSKLIGALEFSKFSNNAGEDVIELPLKLNGTSMDTYSEGDDFKNKYVEWDYKTLYDLYFGNSEHMPDYRILLPLSVEKLSESLSDVSQFYFLCSLSISELNGAQNQRVPIEIGDNYLQSLVNREVMTDDYLSHDRLSADFVQIYNGRVNLAGVKRYLFEGFLPGSMLSYRNSGEPTVTSTSNSAGRMVVAFPGVTNNFLTAQVYVKDGDGSIHIVETPEHVFMTGKYVTSASRLTSWGCYVFYPNVNAFKMIVKNTHDTEKYVIDLKPHPFLNGAYAVLDYEQTRPTVIPPSIAATGSGIVTLPNKIYTSEVNNPFVFPVTGINTIGIGRILGISTAAKALSQGQFGQFPLYAFTDEGVWALEVSPTGTYSAKQPVTRDVCINPDSITQIDSSVLFATSRGIMLISGAQAKCITDTIYTQGMVSFDLTEMNGYDNLVTVFNGLSSSSEIIETSDILSVQLNPVYLEECQMIYDYVHQRLIVFHYESSCALVYSFKSGGWGMIKIQLEYAVNSYPDAMAVKTESNRKILINFSDSSSDESTALIMTRPFKLGDPNLFKTIDTVIQRGLFRRGNIRQVLYGSNDLEHWHVIWSSADSYMRGFRGTPYKAFRLAVVCSMSSHESLYGCSVQFTPRRNNQLR